DTCNTHCRSLRPPRDRHPGTQPDDVIKKLLRSRFVPFTAASAPPQLDPRSEAPLPIGCSATLMLPVSSTANVSGELAKETRQSGDQPVIGRFENHRRGGPLPEGAIGPPGVKDERDTGVEEPAYKRTVCIPKIEIQYTRREVSMTRQTQCLVQMRIGEHL